MVGFSLVRVWHPWQDSIESVPDLYDQWYRSSSIRLASVFAYAHYGLLQSIDKVVFFCIFDRQGLCKRLTKQTVTPCVDYCQQQQTQHQIDKHNVPDSV